MTFEKKSNACIKLHSWRLKPFSVTVENIPKRADRGSVKKASAAVAETVAAHRKYFAATLLITKKKFLWCPWHMEPSFLAALTAV